MGLKKVHKQGRDERTQEDYPTPAKNTQQMLGSLFEYFYLCLVSLLFSGPTLTKMKFYRKKLFPSFCSFQRLFKLPSK